MEFLHKDLMEYTSSPQVAAVSDPSFLSTTFAFFGLALAVTCTGVYAGFLMMVSSPELFSNPLVFYGAVLVELILVFTSRSWSERLPFGYALFALFALLSGFTLVPILLVAGAAGGVTLVFKALISTVSVFGAAALYGWTTHRNLQGLGGFLFMALIGLIVMGIVSIFLPWSNTLEMVVAGVTIVIFAGFTMVDVQRLQRFQTGNPLIAAIALYLNFINLFISILRLMMAFGNRR